MIFDNLKQVSKNNNLIIIGAGPAGITIALELEKKGIPSIIFEEAGDICELVMPLLPLET